MTTSPKKKVSKKPQLVPGMYDILPNLDMSWDFLMEKIQRLARGFGFIRVELPILENASLYEGLDIGSHTLVTFLDPQGSRIAVRPETLPGLMRAYADRKVIEGQKLSKWYHCSPVIVYDEKQKKFVNTWEYGFELLGDFSPLIEVQLISLVWKFLKSIGLENLILEINSVGRAEERKDYEDTLRNFLAAKKYELCNECVASIEEYPMQVFRCKNLECRTVAAEAPQVVEYLSEECHKHFTHVLEGLDELRVDYSLNPMLVGKQGTSRTVFSLKYKDEQNEYFIGEGAYHEEMLKDLTGKQNACFGFTGYMEILQKAVQNLKLESLGDTRSEVYLAPLGDLASKKALRLFSELWDAKISVHDHFGDGGVKNQLKLAEGQKALIALIIGQKEAMDDMVILRDVKSGMQELFRYDQIIDEVKKRIGR
ncbi:MAG: histidine--tRNA ligase [Candidatus Doudnabacteria bacterium]